MLVPLRRRNEASGFLVGAGEEDLEAAVRAVCAGMYPAVGHDLFLVGQLGLRGELANVLLRGYPGLRVKQYCATLGTTTARQRLLHR